MSPPCGFDVAYAFSWQIPPDAPIQGVSTLATQKLTVQSSDKNDVGTYSVVLTNEITDHNEATTQFFTKTVSFDVEVIDPCKTTTIAAMTSEDFTPASIELPYGSTATVQWSLPKT